LTSAVASISTDQVSARERVPYWHDSINRLFCGLDSDLYGDTEFDGHMRSSNAGDVVLTRLEANRHRVMRGDSLVRTSPTAYLKIVAPVRGCAIVEQHNRQACVTPGEWSIYDTTRRYAVDNPLRVEHLILMVPRAPLVERGVALDELMARPFGSRGGVARIALETMRSTWQQLPAMSPQAASAVGDVITQLVHLSLMELAGRPSGAAQRESLRDRIKSLVSRRLGDPTLCVAAIAEALDCSRRNLYNAFSAEPDGVAGYILMERLRASQRDLADPRLDARSIAEISVARGFGSTAHFSRAFRHHVGMSPSEYRQARGRSAAGAPA
jgi:AraC-like DNA-binding protein